MIVKPQTLSNPVKTVVMFMARALDPQSQPEANRIWEHIQPFLSPEEIGDIRVAWNHAIVGDGREMMDKAICKVIDRFKETWRQQNG